MLPRRRGYDVLPDLVECSNHKVICQNECNAERPYCQSDFMTVDLCFQICTNQSARYFGLQDGSQCLCGGAYANADLTWAPSAMDKCNKSCTGNSSQICGGSFKISLYEITGESGVPGMGWGIKQNWSPFVQGVRLSSLFWCRIKVSKRLSVWFLQMINAKLFWLGG